VPTPLHARKGKKDVPIVTVNQLPLVSPSLFAGANYVVTSTGWLRAGHVFPQGAVPSGQGVVFAGIDTQNLVLKTWPDGSAKHMLITANMTSTGTKTLQLGTPVTGTFSATAPTITVDATPEGGALRTATFTDTTYANARENGPLCKETREVVGFTSSTGALAQVLVEFYLTSFSDGTHRVAIAINNSKNHVDSGALVATVDMKIAGASVWSKTATVTAGSGTASPSGYDVNFSVAHGLAVNDYIRANDGSGNPNFTKVWRVNSSTGVLATSNLNVPAASSWSKIAFLLPWGAKGIKRFDVSGHDQAAWAPDLETFYTAKAMYRVHAAVIDHSYSDTMAIEDSNLGGKTYTSADFEAFNYGIYRPQISLGGQRPELTITPEWVIEWQKFKTAAQYAWMITHADRAAETSFHLTKSDGTQQKLSDDTTFYYNSADLLGQTIYGEIYSPETNGANGLAHQGGFFFVPYLVTGDWFYQQEMISHAMFGVLNQPAYLNARGDGNGWLFGAGNGLRSGAWVATKLAECIAFLPSTESAFVTEFETIVANNNTKEDYYIGIEPDGVTGHSIMSNERLRVGNTTEVSNPPERNFLSNVSMFDQMFQQGYVVLASDHARRLGVTIYADYRARICAYWANFINQVDVPKHAINGFAFYGMPFMTSGGPLLTFADLQEMLDFNEANNAQFASVPLFDGNDYSQYLRAILAVGAYDGIAHAAAGLSWLEGLTDAGGNYTTDWTHTGVFSYGLSNYAYAFAASEGYR
jgi:hypothetical protein